MSFTVVHVCIEILFVYSYSPKHRVSLKVKDTTVFWSYFHFILYLWNNSKIPCISGYSCSAFNNEDISETVEVLLNPRVMNSTVVFATIALG